MSNDQLFQICNTIVLPAWLLLIFAPRWMWTGRIVIGIVVTLLSLLYAFLVFSMISFDDLAGFGSLEGVSNLFADRGAVLIGWIHYLAFDLLTGWYIVKDGEKNNINRWLRLPCLLFTFMLGPSGLLLYLLLRFILTKRYFLDTIPEKS